MPERHLLQAHAHLSSRPARGLSDRCTPGPLGPSTGLGDGDDTYLDFKDMPGRWGWFYVQAVDASGNAGPWVRCTIEIPLDGVVLRGD